MRAKGRLQRVYGTSGPASGSERLRRLLLVYDEALRACARRQPAELSAALDGLEATLDYAACPELGVLLQALYRQARSRAQAGAYDDAGRILARLRGAWLRRHNSDTRLQR